MLSLKPCIYLDNSATTRYKPKRVVRAVEKELIRSANAGRGGHRESIRTLTKIEECRERIRDITALPEVVFTKSCTEALNLAVFGLYKGGDIITSVYEHNSVLRPIERLKSKGASVTYLSAKDGIIEPSILKKHVNKKTSLVVLQEMSNVTGHIQPIESLGTLLKEYGIPFIVDGAQSLGHVRTNYKDVSCLTASAHKGLYAMQGTGFVAFQKGLDIEPLILGGTGTDGALLTQPKTIPEGYEAGTLGAPGIVGLKEGIDFTYSHFEQIAKKTFYLSKTLMDELQKIREVRLYTTSPNGVISFNIAQKSSTEVADYLDANYGICARPGIHCAPLYHRHLGTLHQGAVRVSLAYDTTEKDVETLLKAVKELVND
ncbi:MAG: aminotransferase class V-fold PLP-dependent enzyme [Clostridia bacterium]|nr:aminotransferase class V-fold PLP-dependent enzyme [Clostridia bacterium]